MKTVLYVDDDPNDRFLVKNAKRIAAVSFDLKTAAGGGVALRYLGGEGEFANRTDHPLPDFILLDLKMPEMDGFEVLRWVRANPATTTTPVALFSSSLIPEDVARGYLNGANYFIIKPAKFATLVDILQAVDEFLATSPNASVSLSKFSAPAEPTGTAIPNSNSGSTSPSHS